MSDVNLGFTVNSSNIDITVQPNDITFTPTDIQLNIFGGGVGVPAGTTGQLQYNNGGALGGVPNTDFDGSNLTLGNIPNIKITGGSANYYMQTDGTGNLSWANLSVGGTNTSVLFNDNSALGGSTNFTFNKTTNTVVAANLVVSTTANLGSASNVKITGGTNGYVLQTDGTGNLDWTAMTGNGGGNGTPGGSNTQIQYNDAGAFGGNAGFTFNEITGLVSLPNALQVTSNISTGNLSATSNISTGNLSVTSNISTSNLSVTSNISTVNLATTGSANLGVIANVKISGGSNGYVLTTDGAGNLSFTSSAVSGGWTSVASIAINDIAVGKLVGVSNGVSPGSTVTIAGNTVANAWATTPTGVANGVAFVQVSDNIFWGLGSYSNLSLNNTVVYSTTARSNTWTTLSTPLQPTRPPIKGANNYAIFALGTNKAAYSNTAGNTWANVTLIGGNLGWTDIASDPANSTFVIASTSNIWQRSTNDGVGWANTTIPYVLGSPAIAYGNGAWLAVGYSKQNAVKSTNNGSTWANVATPGNYLYHDIAYGNGVFMAIAEGTPNAHIIYSSDNGTTWGDKVLGAGTWYSITYANGVWVGADAYTGNIAYSYDNGGNWSFSNSGFTGIPHITHSSLENTLLVSAIDNNANVYTSLTPGISITTSDGNVSNGSSVPAGTYRNLGGVVGDAGALWIRTA